MALNLSSIRKTQRWFSAITLGSGHRLWRGRQTWPCFPLEEFEQAKLFVEQEFTLSERQADGRTLRENLENAERQLKRKPKELEDLVELPEAFQEYWQWFLRLSNHRPSGMGISAIPYSEYVAFFQLIGVAPEPYEIEILEVFDSIALKYYAKQQEKEQARAKQKSTKK